VSTILETRLSPWPTEAECAASARALAGRPALVDAFVELQGPLGAGKTTFARHLLHGLGIDGAIKSPTYTLMEPYCAAPAQGGFEIAHFDFYRFDDPQEWEDAGFRDVFARPGLKLVEWPEKAAGLLPACDLRVTIAPRGGPIAAAGGNEARDARFEALSERGLALLP
jgi:tRNA threonylcarbamoyladenosine biosynthesis protein TsaE